MTLCQAKTLPDRCFNDSTNLRSAYLLRECGFRVISDDCRRIAQGCPRPREGREGIPARLKSGRSESRLGRGHSFIWCKLWRASCTV